MKRIKLYVTWWHSPALYCLAGINGNKGVRSGINQSYHNNACPTAPVYVYVRQYNIFSLKNQKSDAYSSNS